MTDGGRGRRAVHARQAETVNTTATTMLLWIVKWLRTRDGVPRSSVERHARGRRQRDEEAEGGDQGAADAGDHRVRRDGGDDGGGSGGHAREGGYVRDVRGHRGGHALTLSGADKRGEMG